MKLERPKKPIQFVALTLPWKQLPDYPDIGSWKVNADNSPAFIGCADTGNDVSNAAILIHEIVESILCWLKGIKEEDVTSFDKMFFEEQERGLHPPDAEPGRDSRAPYNNEHFVAEQMERHFLTHCGMMWSTHEANCASVYSGSPASKT